MSLPTTTAAAGLRVAILGTRGIPAGYGGFETFAEQLATRLVARGHQITVYAEAEGPVPPDTQYRGVRVRYRRRPHWGGASTLAYDCACLWDACRGYDLVYMLGYGAAWACWWPRLFGVPVWINVDGLEWARSKWGPFARAYLRAMEWVSSRAPTRVLADAQAIADRYTRLYPRGAPCSFIAYGADLPTDPSRAAHELLRWNLQAGEYVLVVARPEPENHVLEIVEGHALWGGDWPLVVVGNVQPTTTYQKRLLALASDKVRFIGGVYDAAQLTALRMGAGCHVHGHSVGGTNPSLLEALACGNLVVAHDNPFNREVARDAAQYFQTGQQLAEALERVRALPTTARQAMAGRAREIVAQNYTWDLIAAQYETLLHAECANAAVEALHQ